MFGGQHQECIFFREFRSRSKIFDRKKHIHFYLKVLTAQENAVYIGHVQLIQVLEFFN